MPRVLVTGATGFVGRVLVRRLLEGGWNVRAAVRAPATLPAGVEVAAVGDLEHPVDWRPALEGVDFVIHLAARVHRSGESGPEVLACYRRTNVLATRRLAEAAATAGVRRMVLMSSVKALGEGGSEPLSAATVPAPAEPYGISKLEAESALAEAAGAGLDWTVLRPPLVYGPGVGANFRRLMQVVRRGVPLPLGAVRNRRSLIYVGNLADAVIRCLDHPAAAGRRFLIQDGEAPAVPELVRRLARLLGRPARLVPVPVPLLRAGAMLVGASAAFTRLCGSLEVDDSELRCTTGWLPPFTLDDGLRATVDDYLSGQ
ncbi:MAG: NAD-dependent epimerase/dehydratase family protein [Rhodospirillaceae bacterium]